MASMSSHAVFHLFIFVFFQQKTLCKKFIKNTRRTCSVMQSPWPPKVRTSSSVKDLSVSSKGCDLLSILQVFFAAFQWPIAQFDLHSVPLGKHLADLQEGLALGLGDHRPDVDQCGQTNKRKNDKAVGA